MPWVSRLGFVLAAVVGCAAGAPPPPALPEDAGRTHAELPGGELVCRLGVGLAALGPRTAEVTTVALEEGARLLDTAQAPEWYDEAAVGAALNASGAALGAFVTTKIHPRDYRPGRVREVVLRSQERLHRAPLDLVLLHNARCWPGHCPDGLLPWQDAWRELERLRAEGAVRHIGVSQFTAADMRELLALASAPVSVLQNWFDPWVQDRECRAICRAHGIVYQGFSTLGTQWGRGAAAALAHPTLAALAARHDAAPARAVLAWALREGVSVIPRSSRREHLRDNAGLVDCLGHGGVAPLVAALTEADLEAVRALDGATPWDQAAGEL